jgi:tetratricopeptide (TPR) repeat protein
LACLSGTFVQARDWESLHRAVAETTPEAAGPEAATGEAAEADVPRAVADDPGYAGTALALLRAGVPQAIAMRYEVGDAYARDLARDFYQGLLADQAPKAPAQALALARSELLRQHAAEHGAVDHATPLVFGRDLPPLTPPPGRSPQLDERRPQPQPLLPGGSTELDRPAAFVGRGRPLTELRARWLDRLAMGAPAVAVVQGLAGPLLDELLAADLLTPDDGAVAFHELVKERATAWIEAHPAERGAREEPEVWRAYGERYQAAFEALTSAGTPGARERAAEAGRRGLAYIIRARAFGELTGFASALVTGTRDPSLLRAVIAELEAVADQVPPGRDRWSLRANLADAFRMAGRPDAALALYEQAAVEAEVAEHWADVGWICGNWANALQNVGRLDAARTTYERSADALSRAGSPRVHVVGSELEALRIDVMQGDAERALPEIERRLDEVRGWWRRRREGETVPEAPDAVLLGRVLVSGLDIARQANLALKRWQPCLDLLEEIEATDRSLGEGEHELARTRFNRYGPLLRLGRFDEAQHLLQGCLQVFRQVDDLTNQSKALSALADLWDERGDRGQAVALERQALAVRNRLPDLADRSISHGNLSNYLDRLGERPEAARHMLAAIVYLVVIRHQEHLNIVLSNLGIHMSRAAASGSRYDLPPLAELLERPDLEALRQVLTDGGVNIEALQAQLDALVEEVRQEAGMDA